MIEDRQLRDFFGKVKRADGETAPGFELVVLRPRRGHLWVWAPAAAVAVALIVLSVRPPATGPTPATISEWRSPTAFLLQAPGRAFLRELPAVGAVNQEVVSCENCF